jgi:hypothetical protein
MTLTRVGEIFMGRGGTKSIPDTCIRFPAYRIRKILHSLGLKAIMTHP